MVAPVFWLALDHRIWSRTDIKLREKMSYTELIWVVKVERFQWNERPSCAHATSEVDQCCVQLVSSKLVSVCWLFLRKPTKTNEIHQFPEDFCFFVWLDAGGTPLVPYILSCATLDIYVHPPPLVAYLKKNACNISRGCSPYSWYILAWFSHEWIRWRGYTVPTGFHTLADHHDKRLTF